MSSPETNDTPSVVAVVPALNRADAIGATVTALVGIDAIDRVVVVDDGSSDGTADAARAAGADVLVLGSNVGKGGAVAAAVSATHEATVYLLIDADLASTAASADVLLAPVLAGEADMTVGVLPPADGRGGFGLIKKLSSRGIERACGYSTQAPLSGQRAVRAEYLRDGLASSARFGLEVAMTIDVVRAGGRVVEVEVPMDHRHTGRTLAGFAHRGRQGLDIAASLWPRVVSERRRIAAVITLTVLVLIGSVVNGGRNVPTTQALDKKPTKVVIFGMEPFGFDDLSRGVTPNLRALMDRGAVAAMSVRGLSRYPSATGGYLSISAGARMGAGPSAGNVIDSDTPVGKMTAAEYVGGLSGTTPRGSLVVIEGPAMAKINDTATAAGKPGTLAELLADKGHDSAVVANSDRPALLSANPTIDRSAALAAMNETFGVAHGTVDSKALLTDDPGAPYGVRADADAFAARTADALKVADMVVVDPGDLTRAQSFMSRANDTAAKSIWDSALRHSDEILGRVVADAGPDTMILVVSVRPPHSEFRLTPMIAAGPGIPRGVITSPSTQRTGLVAITDIAPTVMAALGVAVPDDMPGNALRYEPGSHQLDRLETYDADTNVRERTYAPTTWVYIWGQALVYVLLLFAVARRPRFGGMRPWLRVALSVLAAMPAASFLVRLIPGLTGWFLAAEMIVMSAIAIAIGVFAATRRRTALSPLTWLCGVTIAVITVDIWTGTHLEMSSWLGYSFHSAGRFYGVPNTTFAVLGACTILWSGIIVHYHEHRREALAWVGCVMLVVLVAAGAPMLGADVGTLITLGPIFALAWWVLSGRKIRFKALALAAIGMVVLVVGAAALDLSRPPADRSHLGRFTSDLLTNGPSVLSDTFLRKQSANIRIMKGTTWTRLIPLVALFWFQPLVWERRGEEIFGRRRALRVASWFVLAAAILGFASNDSGPVVVALFLAWLLPLLALLLLGAAQPDAALTFADGSPGVAVETDPFLDPPAQRCDSGDAIGEDAPIETAGGRVMSSAR